MQSEEEWNIGCYFRDVADEVAYYTFTSGRYPKINYIPGNVDKDTRLTTNSNGVLNVYVPQEYNIQQFQQELHAKMSQQYSTLLDNQNNQLNVKVIPCTFRTVEDAQKTIKEQNNANTNTYFRLISDSNNRLYIMVCVAPSLDVKQQIQEQFEPSNGYYYTPINMDVNPNTFDSSSSLSKEEQYLAALKVFATTGIMPFQSLPKPDEDDEEQKQLHLLCKNASEYQPQAQARLRGKLLPIIKYSNENNIDIDEKLKRFAMGIKREIKPNAQGGFSVLLTYPELWQVLGLEPNNPVMPFSQSQGPWSKQSIPFYYNIYPANNMDMDNQQMIDNIANMPKPIDWNALHLINNYNGTYYGLFWTTNGKKLFKFNTLSFKIIPQQNYTYNVYVMPFLNGQPLKGLAGCFQNVLILPADNDPTQRQLAINANGRTTYLPINSNGGIHDLTTTELNNIMQRLAPNMNNQNQQQGCPCIDLNILQLSNGNNGWYSGTFFNASEQPVQAQFNNLRYKATLRGDGNYDVTFIPYQYNNPLVCSFTFRNIKSTSDQCLLVTGNGKLGPILANTKGSLLILGQDFLNRLTPPAPNMNPNMVNNMGNQPNNFYSNQNQNINNPQFNYNNMILNNNNAQNNQYNIGNNMDLNQQGGA